MHGADVAAAGKIRAVERLAAVQDPRAFFPRRRQGGLHVRDRARVDQGAHECSRLLRVPNRHLPVGVHEAPRDFLPKALMDNDAARGRATLAGGADCAEQDRAHREIEVGGWSDDDRVVSPQLEQGAAEAPAHDLAHVPAHAGGAGGGDQREPAHR